MGEGEKTGERGACKFGRPGMGFEQLVRRLTRDDPLLQAPDFRSFRSFRSFGALSLAPGSYIGGSARRLLQLPAGAESGSGFRVPGSEFRVGEKAGSDSPRLCVAASLRFNINAKTPRRREAE